MDQGVSFALGAPAIHQGVRIGGEAKIYSNSLNTSLAACDTTRKTILDLAILWH